MITILRSNANLRFGRFRNIGSQKGRVGSLGLEGLGEGFFRGLDKFRRELRYDRIAESAELIHASGNPISQQGKAGFKAPLSTVFPTASRNFSLDAVPPHLQRAAPPVAVIAVGVDQPSWMASI